MSSVRSRLSWRILLEQPACRLEESQASASPAWPAVAHTPEEELRPDEEPSHAPMRWPPAADIQDAEQRLDEELTSALFWPLVAEADTQEGLLTWLTNGTPSR